MSSTQETRVISEVRTYCIRSEDSPSPITPPLLVAGMTGGLRLSGIFDPIRVGTGSWVSYIYLIYMKTILLWGEIGGWGPFFHGLVLVVEGE